MTTAGAEVTYPKFPDVVAPASDVVTPVSDVAAATVENIILPADTCEWTGRTSAPIPMDLAAVRSGDIIDGGQAALEPAAYFQVSTSGDLDGDGVEDAIVDVLCSGGGTGSTDELQAYKSDGTSLGLIRYGSANRNRPPFSSGGDRESITDVGIDSGVVTVHYVAHLDTDPMCCPSLQVTDTFSLNGGSFELIDRVSVPASDDGAESTPSDGTAADAAGAQRNPGGAYSEYGVYERVEFPPGSTGTTVSAAVAPHTVNGYLVNASAGQTLYVELTAENAVFDLYAPDDTLIASGSTGPEIHELRIDGDYLVVVQSEFGGAEFDLLLDATWPPVIASSNPCTRLVEFVDFPLHLCHKGPKVTELQQYLKERWGYAIDVDGQFGPGTQAALLDHTGLATVNSARDFLAILAGANTD